MYNEIVIPDDNSDVKYSLDSTLAHCQLSRQNILNYLSKQIPVYCDIPFSQILILQDDLYLHSSENNTGIGLGSFSDLPFWDHSPDRRRFYQQFTLLIILRYLEDLTMADLVDILDLPIKQYMFTAQHQRTLFDAPLYLGIPQLVIEQKTLPLYSYLDGNIFNFDVPFYFDVQNYMLEYRPLEIILIGNSRRNNLRGVLTGNSPLNTLNILTKNSDAARIRYINHTAFRCKKYKSKKFIPFNMSPYIVFTKINLHHVDCIYFSNMSMNNDENICRLIKIFFSNMNSNFLPDFIIECVSSINGSDEAIDFLIEMKYTIFSSRIVILRPSQESYSLISEWQDFYGSLFC